jgi:hypothetical protein
MNHVAPRVVDLPDVSLAGLSFFGDPFTSHAGWTEENEIGRLWTRLGGRLRRSGSAAPHLMYEVHVRTEESLVTGEFEVFAGYAVPGPDAPGPGSLAVDLVGKTLPAGPYVEVELRGSQIVGEGPALGEWLGAQGLREGGPFIVLLYDDRFLGMDRLDESTVTFRMPVRAVGGDDDGPA